MYGFISPKLPGLKLKKPKMKKLAISDGGGRSNLMGVTCT